MVIKSHFSTFGARVLRAWGFAPKSYVYPLQLRLSFDVDAARWCRSCLFDQLHDRLSLLFVGIQLLRKNRGRDV